MGEEINFQDIANHLAFTATCLQGTATESALKAKTFTANMKQRESQPAKHCKLHPMATSHNTKDCFMKMHQEEKEKGKGKAAMHKAMATAALSEGDSS